MSIKRKNISISAEALPRVPRHDAWCAPNFFSAFYSVGRQYQILRSLGLPSLYLTFTLAGKGFFRDRTNHFQKVSAGDLSILEAGAYQNYGTWPQDAHWRHHWVHFQPLPSLKKWIQALPEGEVKGLKVLHLGRTPARAAISKLLFSLHPTREKNHLVNNPLEEALALNTVEKAVLIAVQQGLRRPPNVDPKVAKALEWFQSGDALSKRQSELEAYVGISLSRLRHLFRQQAGLSLSAARNRMRLDEAKRVLSDPHASVQAAAEALKFSNQFSFSKWFLKQSGQRPSSYRRSVIHYSKQGIPAPLPPLSKKGEIKYLLKSILP